MLSFHDDAPPICGFAKSVVCPPPQHAPGMAFQAVGDVSTAGLDVGDRRDGSALSWCFRYCSSMRSKDALAAARLPNLGSDTRWGTR